MSNQLTGENSTPVKGAERVLPSYVVYGEANEPFPKLAMVLRSGRMFCIILSLVSLFYVMGGSQRWSGGQACVTSLNARGHLNTTSSILRNSGSPDRGNLWGDGGIVVARRGLTTFQAKDSRRLSTKASGPTGPEKLVELRKLHKANPNHISHNLIDILTDVDLLIYAYGKIKSKPGNMTPGSDGVTLDGIDLDWFHKTSRELATGQYKFKPCQEDKSCGPFFLRKKKRNSLRSFASPYGPSRRVEIPKSNGGTRPLGVVSPRDKIVQEVMRLILEATFEDNFSKSSHGFRPNKNCHSALNMVKMEFGSVCWFVEGDISKCFDSFDHNLLITAVSARIKDQVFIDLLYKALRAGYLDPQGSFRSLKLGTPQGSIISPILCNIYLDQLDKWMERYILSFNQGKKRKQNGAPVGHLAFAPEYTKMVRGNSSRSPEERRARVRYIHENKIRQFLYTDQSFKRLRYVRYADDILLGVIGSRADCIQIREDFLEKKLKLTLSMAKTKITHATYDFALFLGTMIRVTPYGSKPIRRISRLGEERVTKVSTRPQLLAPIPKLVEKLRLRGYCKNGSLGNPTRVGRYIHYPLETIINLYLYIARGYINYYSFVDNYARMRARVLYITQYSLALTFASKLKLRTLHKVFKKFGPNLTVKDDKGKVLAEFDTSKFPTSAPGFKLGINYDPLQYVEHMSNITRRTYKLLESSCHICGREENLQVHHVKHLRKMGKTVIKDYLLAGMVRMNRKQITVCVHCHNAIHRGKYDGPAL
uniref:Reverse transcriptase domain-containing protein n=1 Tax=Coleochaete scutata TaxID=3125 RepID=A0A5P9NVX9_COLSC|nr:hypothetical protein [Coleochaete scutata]QFU80119.1 hypothetical protein [Coleochaete scutata]